MEVSVVIPTYLRSPYLLQTIREVIRIGHTAVREIIVIDQTPKESIPSDFYNQLSELKQQINIVYIHRSVANLPAARNAALAIAKGEIVIMLDDDVLLPSDFIEEHLNCYLQSQHVVCVAGLPYHRKFNFLDSIGKIDLDNFREYTHPHFKETKRDDHWKGLLVGANHSILKKYAIEAGGYDETFLGNALYEESDFIQRFKKRFPNKTIVYNPAAFVVHLRAPSGGCRRDDLKEKEAWLMTFSTHIYMWRHTRNAERRKLFFKSIRIGPLQKKNVIRFWKQPRAWHGFVKSLLYAYRKRKTPSSLFINS